MKLIDPNPNIRELVMDADVWQSGHTKLNSGLHTDVKLDMEKLINHRRNFIAIMSTVADKFFTLEVDGVVAVPKGAKRLLDKTFPMPLPQVVPASRTAERQFDFDQPWAQRFLQKAGRIAIFDDVLTTGGSPLAMANTVRQVNPDIELDLVAIWRRGELVPGVAETFDSQTYLVEEMVPAWPAKDCPQCPSY